MSFIRQAAKATRHYRKILRVWRAYALTQPIKQRVNRDRISCCATAKLPCLPKSFHPSCDIANVVTARTSSLRPLDVGDPLERRTADNVQVPLARHATEHLPHGDKVAWRPNRGSRLRRGRGGKAFDVQLEYGDG